MATDWPRLTNLVGRAVARLDHTELATRALGHMLDVLERRYEAGMLERAVMANAIAWVERIEAVGYVAAMPWTGWLPMPSGDVGSTGLEGLGPC